MHVVTPTDRPKSVRNLRSYVIEDFGGVFCVVTLLLEFSVGVLFFCRRTQSDIFLFHSMQGNKCFISI